MQYKWDVSRIGYADGCTGRVFENNGFRFEAIQNRHENSLILHVYDASDGRQLFEAPFKSMESLEKAISKLAENR